MAIKLERQLIQRMTPPQLNNYCAEDEVERRYYTISFDFPTSLNLLFEKGNVHITHIYTDQIIAYRGTICMLTLATDSLGENDSYPAKIKSRGWAWLHPSDAFSLQETHTDDELAAIRFEHIGKRKAIDRALDAIDTIFTGQLRSRWKLLRRFIIGELFPELRSKVIGQLEVTCSSSTDTQSVPEQSAKKDLSPIDLPPEKCSTLAIAIYWTISERGPLTASEIVNILRNSSVLVNRKNKNKAVRNTIYRYQDLFVKSATTPIVYNIIQNK